MSRGGVQPFDLVQKLRASLSTLLAIVRVPNTTNNRYRNSTGCSSNNPASNRRNRKTVPTVFLKRQTD
jgi:hypothetical protein